MPAPVFDAHLHIIDPRFPLIENQGYLPDPFTVENYQTQATPLQIEGGAVVSGSFQGFDQTYLTDALRQLGPGFVGVTQLPASTSDPQLDQLHQQGVRAIRFNVRRGGSESIDQLAVFSKRVFERLGWHTELYIDSTQLEGLQSILRQLPKVSIDHLGLSAAGLPTLLKLVESGVRVKATGFGRVDFDVPTVLSQIHQCNPQALMFGTDLPSTRAPRPFNASDLALITETLGDAAAERVLWHNAAAWYQLPEQTAHATN